MINLSVAITGTKSKLQPPNVKIVYNIYQGKIAAEGAADSDNLSLSEGHLKRKQMKQPLPSSMSGGRPPTKTFLE